MALRGPDFVQEDEELVTVSRSGKREEPAQPHDPDGLTKVQRDMIILTCIIWGVWAVVAAVWAADLAKQQNESQTGGYGRTY